MTTSLAKISDQEYTDDELRFGMTTELMRGMKIRIFYDVQPTADNVTRLISGEWRALKNRVIQAFSASPDIQLLDDGIKPDDDNLTLAVHRFWIEALILDTTQPGWIFPDVWQVQDADHGLEPTTLIATGLQVAGIGEQLPPDPNSFAATWNNVVDKAGDVVTGATGAVAGVAADALGTTASELRDQFSYGQRLMIFVALLAALAVGVYVAAEKVGV